MKDLNEKLDPNYYRDPAARQRGAEVGVNTGFLIGFVGSILIYYWDGEGGKAQCNTPLVRWHLINWAVSLGGFGVTLILFGIAKVVAFLNRVAGILTALVNVGCGGFLFVWYCIGNNDLWSTRPCEDLYIYSTQTDGSIVVTRKPDEGPCCDVYVWDATRYYFIFTYFMMGILCCCCCCVVGAAVSSPQMRAAAERVRRGENMTAVAADVQRSFDRSNDPPPQGKTEATRLVDDV